MPLTDKGKEIKNKMVKQYGKKKGESVFYAMENSGKLKKVVKLSVGGGRDASKSDFGGNTPGPGDTGGEGGYSPKSTNQFGNRGSSPTSTGGNTTPKQTTTQKAGFNINPITTGLNLVGSLTAKVPGLGFAFEVGKKAVQGIQKTTRQQTAKGETLFGNAKAGNAGMPITRDYYRTTGTKLDVMSPQGSQYMKDAGFLKGPKLNTDTRGGGKQLCPDGTTPPCKTPVTQIKNPVSTPNTFLSGFKAYDDGGEVVISSNVDKDLL
jgi:hypothetical protein